MDGASYSSGSSSSSDAGSPPMNVPSTDLETMAKRYHDNLFKYTHEQWQVTEKKRLRREQAAQHADEMSA
ncbi:uncharacterized protein L969DRAFT_85981 [Mixia osmundae IAM 14324]|nr:uncharacterized protein L969DRAFT_85981 [Mixia osmundae IAM 14324]KEI40758.1 hypothetical protein L969DRAFT_85981 [Mixia osmundae IAM 14324]